ncbi:MAG: peptidoglycan-associated lipoprotein Pal [Rickettsiales bacterium]|jgi:peptidoglycan-associated lipoprotein|nr:peptidoglycan-associated lipoprotein Pal [Rickettsiales bacterium]
MNKKLLLPLIVFTLVGCAKDYKVDDPQPKKEASASEEKIEKGTEDRVFFAFDSAVLGGDAKKILAKVAAKLAKDKEAKTITIEGHCDERGTREYNLALGQRRANSTKKYLISKGISSKRIRTISYGKERPAVAGSGEAVWARNRRAVVISK